MSNKKTILLGVLVGFLSFCVYLPTLGYGFVNWDDASYVYNNPHIRNLDFEFLKWVFTSSYSSNWHPLTLITYAIDYSFWGLNPGGYHLTNIVLHGLNVFLVFILAHMLISEAGQKDGVNFLQGGFGAVASALVAILFGFHPLHAESVAWISERKDVLYSFFFLLSLLFYTRYAVRQARRRTNLAASVFFFLLSAMSKPMAITLPAVLLILDFYPLERLYARGLKRIIIEKIPFFLISVMLAALNMSAQSNAIASLYVVDPKYRLFLGARAYSFYLQKTFLPAGLLPFYPHPVNFRIWSMEYMGSVLFFVAISLLTILMIRRHKAAFASWAYYVITILPIAGFVQVGSQAYADRYMYLPSLGICMLVGIGISSLSVRYAGSRLPAMVAAFLLAVTLGALTINQAGIWKDSVTLWSYELKQLDFTEADSHLIILDSGRAVASTKILPYYNRAEAYSRAGDFAKAIGDYDSILALNRYEPDALISRSKAYGGLGQYDRALADLAEAEKLVPQNPEVYRNKGIIYASIGDNENALKYLAIARQLSEAKRLEQTGRSK